MALGAQFLGMTSLADRVLPVDSVVNFTENGPFKGPPVIHQLAPHTCLISSHSVELACPHTHFQINKYIFLNKKINMFLSMSVGGVYKSDHSVLST